MWSQGTRYNLTAFTVQTNQVWRGRTYTSSYNLQTREINANDRWTYLVDVIRVSVGVEAVVQVVEHVDDVISWAVCCDVSERHNVAEENCAALVPLCKTAKL